MTISTQILAFSRLTQSGLPSPRLVYGQKMTNCSLFGCRVNMIKVKCSEVLVIPTQRTLASTEINKPVLLRHSRVLYNPLVLFTASGQFSLAGFFRSVAASIVGSVIPKLAWITVRIWRAVRSFFELFQRLFHKALWAHFFVCHELSLPQTGDLSKFNLAL